MIFWYFVVLAIILIIGWTNYFEKKKGINCCRRRVRVLFRFTKLSMMYGFILRILLEGVFTLSVSVFLNYQMLQWDNPTDKFEFIFTVLLSVVLIALPISTAVLLLKCRKKLKGKVFKRKFGTFYEELKIEETPALLSNVVFLSRRLLFVCYIFLMEKYPAL